MVENFASILQSGDQVVLTNETVFCVWLFSPPLGGRTKTLDKDYMAMDNAHAHRKYEQVTDSKCSLAKARLRRDTIQLCIDADVNSNVKAMSRFELCQFLLFCVTIYISSISQTVTVNVPSEWIPTKSLVLLISIW